jgi:hypothetical protein
MYWKEIKKTKHFEQYHKDILAWSDIVKLLFLIKNKRKKGSKIEIEDNKFYILCELKNEFYM